MDRQKKTAVYIATHSLLARAGLRHPGSSERKGLGPGHVSKIVVDTKYEKQPAFSPPNDEASSATEIFPGENTCGVLLYFDGNSD